MSDSSADQNRAEMDPESHLEIDPGEPIAALAGFEHNASTGLLSRFRRAVYRRTTVAQLTTFSTSMPLAILMEFWNILVEQLSPQSKRKEVRRGEKTS
jgi:hypothetical protein